MSLKYLTQFVCLKYSSMESGKERLLWISLSAKLIIVKLQCIGQQEQHRQALTSENVVLSCMILLEVKAEDRYRFYGH